MKILLVKLSALGDVVNSLPVAMAIRRQRPEAVIHWVAEETAADLLKGHPALDKVWLSPRRAWRNNSAQGIKATLAFLRRFRQERYDAVLDLQGLMKSAIFVFLSRAERKIGFADEKEPSAWALNEVLPAYDLERHALERYLDLLQPLGFNRPATPEFGLDPSPDLLADLSKSLGLANNSPLVIMHPGALWQSKLWPVDYWAALAAGLKDHGFNVAFSGSKADQSLTAPAAAQAEVRDLAGAFDLKQVAALYALAGLVVTVDTGTMHLAAALKRPVLGLFGPTAPWRTGPYGSGHEVLRPARSCSPCFKRSCPESKWCMEQIKPETVLNTAVNMLN